MCSNFIQEVLNFVVLTQDNFISSKTNKNVFLGNRIKYMDEGASLDSKNYAKYDKPKTFLDT